MTAKKPVDADARIEDLELPKETEVKSQMCAEESCELKVYCEGWCHMHFLARFSVSTKKPKSLYAF